jgi:hypothetical protein
MCGSAATRLLLFRVRIPPGQWMTVSCVCCVGSDLYDVSMVCRVCYHVCVCVIRCNNDPPHLEWIGRKGLTKKEGMRKRTATYITYASICIIRRLAWPRKYYSFLAADGNENSIKNLSNLQFRTSNDKYHYLP